MQLSSESFGKILKLKRSLSAEKLLEMKNITAASQSDLFQILNQKIEDVSLDELQSGFFEIEEIEQVLKTMDAKSLSSMVYKYPKEHILKYMENRITSGCSETQLIEICKMNFFLQQNGIDIGDDNLGVKIGLFNEILFKTILHRKEYGSFFQNIHPFMNQNDYMQLMDYAYEADDLYPEFGWDYCRDIAEAIAGAMLRAKKNYPDSIPVYIEERIWKEYVDQYMIMKKEKPKSYETALQLKNTLNIGIAFGMSEKHPDAYIELFNETKTSPFPNTFL